MTPILERVYSFFFPHTITHPRPVFERWKQIPIPTVEHTLAAHVLGGAHIQQIQIAGEKIEGFNQAAFLAYYRDQMQKIAETLHEQERPAVQKLLRELESGLEIERISQELDRTTSWEERSQAFTAKMLEKLQTLPRGDSILVLGGWAGVQEQPGHALLYRITKEKSGDFSFEIYNTGAGLDFHPKALHEGQEIYTQKLKKTVSADRMLQPLFWQGHYELRYEPIPGAKPISGGQFYQWLNALEGSFLQKAYKETVNQKDVELRRAQIGGVCTFDSLLAYTKAQLKGQDRAFYHAFKKKLQLSTLDEYWKYLTSEKILATKGLDTPTAEKNLSILSLVAQEVHTVQRTLFKNRKKRGEKEDSQIARLQNLQEGVLAAKQACNLALSSEKALVFPKTCTPALLPKLEPSLATASLKTYYDTPSKGVDDPICEFISGPASHDPYWEKSDKKLLLFNIKNVFKTMSCNTATEMVARIKGLAIFVRLQKAKKWSDPFLNTYPIDRQCIQELLQPPCSLLLSTVEANLAKECGEDIRYLLENTVENGLFHELFVEKIEIDFAEPSPQPNSLVNCAKKHWESLTKEEREKQKQIALQALSDPLKVPRSDVQWARHMLYVDLMSEEFTSIHTILKNLTSCTYGWSKSGDTKLAKEDTSFNKTLVKTNLFDTYSLNENSAKEFLDWLTPLEERSLREGLADREENSVHFQLKLLSSADDPSFRLVHAMEFFTKRMDLLKQEKYRKFLWAIFFQISQTGQVALHEYFTKFQDKGFERLSQFIQGGYQASMDDPEVAMGFLELGIAVADYSRVFRNKIECPVSAEQLETFASKENIAISSRLDSCLVRYCLLFPKEDMYRLLPYIQDTQYLQQNIGSHARMRWPFDIRCSLVKEYLTTLVSDKERRNRFYSSYVFGQVRPEDVWTPGIRSVSCKEFSLDLETGTIWHGVLEKLKRNPLFEEIVKIDLFWKKNHAKWHSIGASGSIGNGALFVRDLDSGGIYRIMFRDSEIVGIYEQKANQFESLSWELVPSLHSLDAETGLLRRMGISAEHGWLAEWNNEKGEITLTQHGQEKVLLCKSLNHPGEYVVKEKSTDYVALNMFHSYPPCKELLALDPKGQLWGKKDVKGELQPTRFNSPKLGLVFTIDDQGKIFGEATGWEYLPNHHIASLPGVHPKIVLRDTTTKKLRVLIPDGKMQRSPDLAKSMVLSPWQEERNTLYTFDVHSSGEVLANTREEALYLANLCFHARRPEEALRYLKESQRTDAYTTAELQLLHRFVKDTAEHQDISSLCLHLQAGLLLKNSLDRPRLPWQKSTFLDEVNQKDIEKSITKLSEDLEAVFHQYWKWIVHVPAGLRLPKEEEQRLYRTFGKPKPSSTKPLAQESIGYVRWTDLELWIDRSQKRIDKDILTNTPLPLHIQEEKFRKNFLSFYAIAKEGNAKQKEQLRYWLTAYLSVQSPENKDLRQSARVLLAILGMGFFRRRSLPQVSDLKAENEQQRQNATWKLAGILNKVGTIPANTPPITPIISIPKGTHTKSLRKGRLHVEDRVQKRMKIAPLLKDLVANAKKPLFEPSELSQFKKKEKGIPAEKEEISIHPVDPEGSSSYKSAFTRLEGHAKAYQDTIAKEPEWRIEEPESLKKTIQDKITVSETDFTQKKAALLAKVKELGLEGEKRVLHLMEVSANLRAPIEWEDLLYLFAKQDSNAYRHRLPHLTDEQAEEIYQETALCLVAQTKLQRLQRAKKLVEEKKDTAAYQLLAREKLDYPLDQCPAILLLEALSDMELRQDQISKLQKLTNQNESVLLEAIMGSGKSEVLLPIFAQTVADGENLVCVALPKEQMQSAGNRFESKLKRLFAQNSVQIHWKDVSQENLEAIYKRLLEAMRNGEVVRFHADELQHFFLEEQAIFDSYFQGNLSAKARLDLFRNIRKLLHEKGIVFVDEVHLQLSRKRECQKPMDTKLSIEPRYIEIATQLQELLFDDTVTEQFFFQTTHKRKETAVPFVQEKHKEDFAKVLAGVFVKKRYQNDLGKQQAVLQFLTASDETVADALKVLEPKEQAELAFARGQMRVILPSTLSRKWGEDYGCFPPIDEMNDLPQYLAGPYRLSQPVRGSTFATPDELLAFTIQSYLMTGIPEVILRDILGALLRDAKQEVRTSSRQLEETEIYLMYKELVGEELAKKSPLDKPEYGLLLEAIRKDQKLLFAFLKRFILPKIVQYPLTAYVNGYSFFRRFRTVKGVSGTLPNPFTFHFRFEQAVAPEIEGEAFVLLSTQKPRLMQKKREGLDLVTQLCKKATGKERALVDQGGLIRDEGNQVAKTILEHANEQIKRVIYFAGDEQMVLERNAELPEKYDPAKHPKESSFTFYDQAHATGTDIAQKEDAIAWVTLSEVTSYSNACQAGFRMRGLKGGQSVQFVASYELTRVLRETYKDQAVFSAADLLRYAKHIQVKEAEEDNVKAVLDQLKELFLEKCCQLLDAKPDDEALFEMTLRESLMDPIATYASSSQPEKPEILFARVKKELLEKLSTRLKKPILIHLSEEMQKLIDKAICKENRQVPDKVSSNQAVSEGREVEQQLEQQLEQQQQQELSLFRLRLPSSGHVGQAVPRFLPGATKIDLVAQAQLPSLPKNRFQDKESCSAYPVALLVRDRLQRGKEGLLSQEEAETFLKSLPEKVLFSLDAVSAVAGEPPFGINQMACGDVLLVPDPTHPNDPYIFVLSKAERDAWLAAIRNPEQPLPQGFANCSLFSTASAHWFKNGILAMRGESIVLSDDARKRLTLTKWLMGDCKAYSVEEIAFLKGWLQGQTNTKNISQVFRSFFLPQEEESIYLGSPLEICVQKIMNERQESIHIPQKSPLTMRRERKASRSLLTTALMYSLFPFWVVYKLYRNISSFIKRKRS